MSQPNDRGGSRTVGQSSFHPPVTFHLSHAIQNSSTLPWPDTRHSGEAGRGHVGSAAGVPGERGRVSSPDRDECVGWSGEDSLSGWINIDVFVVWLRFAGFETDPLGGWLRFAEFGTGPLCRWLRFADSGSAGLGGWLRFANMGSGNSAVLGFVRRVMVQREMEKRGLGDKVECTLGGGTGNALLISLRPSLITEHHFVSTLNDLARNLAPRSAERGLGMANGQPRALGCERWFRCVPSACKHALASRKRPSTEDRRPRSPLGNPASVDQTEERGGHLGK